jgi:hypothetical protein
MKGERTINIEYLVMQTLPEKGSFAVVSASKLNRSSEALQEALDELSPQGGDLCTAIYSPTWLGKELIWLSTLPSEPGGRVASQPA